LFSTEEAKACLSKVTLLVAGDSYNRQLFIGLSDIILGNPSNDELRSGARRNAVLAEKRKVSWEKVSQHILLAILRSSNNIEPGFGTGGWSGCAV
jgi:hypothetical protein